LDADDIRHSSVSFTAAENLVDLPADVHNIIHRNSYIVWVNRRLNGKMSAEDIKKELERIARELEKMTPEDVEKKFPKKK